MAPEILFSLIDINLDSKYSDDEQHDELLNYLYSQESDVWSFGIVMYEIISQKLPYNGIINNNIHYHHLIQLF